MFVYCFDLDEKNKLQQSLKLLSESNIDNKQCWIFIIKDEKFNFNLIDKSKCVVTNRMMF